MANFTFTLEKYHGIKSRHTCPNCQTKNQFVRYIDESGNHLSDEVGKCNRESNCAYRFTPKRFLADNPTFPQMVRQGFHRKRQSESLKTKGKSKEKTDFIGFDVLQKTVTNYEQNSFVQFLFDLFRDDIEAVKYILTKYLIGTWQNSKTVFWQIDQKGNIRTGKIIAYDLTTGERRKDVFPNWIHSELIKQCKLNKDFQLQQCFFGEHLLRKEPGKTVAVVEAEKTAVIASICFPEMIWLAIGAKGYLQVEKFQILANRKVLLFPDADAYSDWQEKAVKAQRNGFDVRISDLVEIHGSQIEKHKGFDLADYLIQEQKAKNQYNSFVDCYNALLEKVLNDESLMQEFETNLDEQKAVLITDGNLSEIEAERIITNSENLRKIVMSLA